MFVIVTCRSEAIDAAEHGSWERGRVTGRWTWKTKLRLSVHDAELRPGCGAGCGNKLFRHCRRSARKFQRSRISYTLPRSRSQHYTQLVCCPVWQDQRRTRIFHWGPMTTLLFPFIPPFPCPHPHPLLAGVRGITSGNFFDFTDARRWVLVHFGYKK